MVVSPRRQERINSLLRDLTSSFIKSEFETKIMVTVMRVETTRDLRQAKIFLSIFPEEKEKEALKSLLGKLPQLHQYLQSKLKIKFLPKVSFAIDRAIKLERKIEEILKNTAR